MKIHTLLSLPKSARNFTRLVFSIWSRCKWQLLISNFARSLVYSCDLGDVPIPKEPLDRLLWAHSEKWGYTQGKWTVGDTSSNREPTKTALVCGVSGRSYTYRCSELKCSFSMSDSREAAKCSASVTSWFLDQVYCHSMHRLILDLGRQTRRCGSSSPGKLSRVCNTL